MFKRKPSIVKELRDGLVTPRPAGQEGLSPTGGIDQLERAEAGSGKGRGVRWLLKSGRWRRPYGAFTALLTVGAGLAVLETQTRSPLDEYGREHCFTALYYWRENAVDKLLGLESAKPAPNPRSEQ